MLSRDAPQPTDIDDRLMALRRKQAGYLFISFRLHSTHTHHLPPFSSPMRIKEKLDRDQQRILIQQSQLSPSPSGSQPPIQPTPRHDRTPKQSATPTRAAVPQIQRRHAPQVIVSRPSGEADHEGFSRLKITSSPTPRPGSSKPKLFNPDTDPIPIRRTAEPDTMSDSDSSNIPRNLPNTRSSGTNAARQLFDHRRHDPVHFNVLARPQQSTSPHATHTERTVPTPRSSGDYVSAGSTSSYAASISSSNFTLSTDDSSTSSALFDNRPGHAPTDDSSTSAFSQQLKLIYRRITTLESKIQQEESDEIEEMDARVLVRGRDLGREDLEKEKWMKKVEDHKR